MSIAEIRQLPVEEKLRLMDALWADLAKNEESVVSPSWHEPALRETEAAYKEGRLESLDWAEAKKELRRRFE